MFKFRSDSSELLPGVCRQCSQEEIFAVNTPAPDQQGWGE